MLGGSGGEEGDLQNATFARLILSSLLLITVYHRGEEGEERIHVDFDHLAYLKL